ncbi:MAG: hypothetical protein IJY48_07430 [Mailhella sp.]|nr:hypothetical protein [Mailhella sp.]
MNMIISLLRKEWIKLRLLWWVPFLVMTAALVDPLLSWRTMSSVHGAPAVWSQIIYEEAVHFTKMQSVFVFAGLWFAGAQMIPECTGGRLRLLFHLPVSHRLSLRLITVTGLIGIAALFLFSLAGFWCITRAIGFPPELIVHMAGTLYPWALAGAVAWCSLAAALADPSPLRKLAIALAGTAFVSMLISTRGFSSMNDYLWAYILICMPWPFAVEAAALRVKEGT